MDRDELGLWLRLALTHGVGNTTARKLLASFGMPASIFSQSTTALAHVVSAAQSAALQSIPPHRETLTDTTWQWLQADPEHRRVLTLGDPSYPASLLHMEDPPFMLYAMGTAAAWQADGLASLAPRSLAVVGSRNPTPQGAATAQQFARALAQAGLTIVSGLALGVDGSAHQGALEGAGNSHLATIAVVGTGLDRVYPRQHRELAHRICEHGILLSEYHLGTPPLASNFPQRNRIIAGLSHGTLVVEAALQSGSLITARLTSEQGKDVFAIPGSIHAPQSKGCHALIKQGAKLVDVAQDILDEWTPGFHPAPSVDTTTPLPSAGDPLLQALGFEPCGLDALLARTGLDTPTLQARLMELEIEGHLARLPGGLFQRLALA